MIVKIFFSTSCIGSPFDILGTSILPIEYTEMRIGRVSISLTKIVYKDLKSLLVDSPLQDFGLFFPFLQENTRSKTEIKISAEIDILHNKESTKKGTF